MNARAVSSLLLFALCQSCATTGVGTVRRAGGDVIEVVRATYGENCSAARGNATAPLAKACDGKERCEYRVDATVIGDPAVGCGKQFAVDWRCGGAFHRQVLGGEAGFGSRLVLTCDEVGTSTPIDAPADLGPIRVVGATYGQSCGAPDGNATAAVAKTCNGETRCDYHVQSAVLGDPRKGCLKNFVVEWHCGQSERLFRQALVGESGFGSRVTLLCGSPPAVVR